MRNKIIIIFYLILNCILSNGQPSPTFTPSLAGYMQRYWNYRYHVVGDAINRSQHFPSDCDFLKPSGTGEAGMMVIGAAPKMWFAMAVLM